MNPTFNGTHRLVKVTYTVEVLDKQVGYNRQEGYYNILVDLVIIIWIIWPTCKYSGILLLVVFSYLFHQPHCWNVSNVSNNIFLLILQWVSVVLGRLECGHWRVNNILYYIFRFKISELISNSKLWKILSKHWKNQ